MTRYKLQLNTQQIKQTIAVSMGETVAAIDDAFKQAIDKPLYPWQNSTRRRSGEIAFSPRNIVDLGNLRNSQNYKQTGTTTYLFSWDVPYSGLVHEGGYTQGKNPRYYPGRPWITWGIKGDTNAPLRYQRPGAFLDVPQYFAAKYNADTDSQ